MFNQLDCLHYGSKRNNNFVMNAVGVTKSSTGEELAVHIVAFYPRDPDLKTNLQRIEPNQFVRVRGNLWWMTQM